MRRVLMVSHVPPVEGGSGQRARTAAMAEALARRFVVDLLWVGPPEAARGVASNAVRTVHTIIPNTSPTAKVKAHLQGLRHGMPSTVGYLPTWVKAAYPPEHPLWQRYDAVVFEYVHYAPVAAQLRKRGVRTVADLHNVLWRARTGESPFARFRRRRARRWEERAYAAFDLLIAINQEEAQYLTHLGHSVIHCPMGIDLRHYPFAWAPSADRWQWLYYGAATSHRNRRHIQFLIQVMRRIRRRYPASELHLVGAGTEAYHNPSEGIIGHGYLSSPVAVARHAAMALLPWEGRYGFRSRAIELSAWGVPIAATPDAFAGTRYRAGIHYLGMPSPHSPHEWARELVRLATDPTRPAAVSGAARRLVEQHYTFEAAYLPFVEAFGRWMR